MRRNNFSNGAGAITDRTLEKQAFLIIPEGVAEVIFAHRLSGPWGMRRGGLLAEIPADMVVPREKMSRNPQRRRFIYEGQL